MNMNFSEWLLEQLAEREWNQSELAARAGVARATISNVISGKRQAGAELCISIARALNLPPETVLRAAGILPRASPRTEYEEILTHLTRGMTEESRQVLLSIAEKLSEEEIRKQIQRLSKIEPGDTGSISKKKIRTNEL